MSDHEHAYLICENKCLVEGVPKEQYDSEMADTLKLENKGTAGGVAPLDAHGKVPDDFLSVIKDVQKADGTSLKDAEGIAKLPEIPDASTLQKTSEKNAANGYCGLDSSGKVANSKLQGNPSYSYSSTTAYYYEGGSASGKSQDVYYQYLKFGTLVILSFYLPKYTSVSWDDCRSFYIDLPYTFSSTSYMAFASDEGNDNNSEKTNTGHYRTHSTSRVYWARKYASSRPLFLTITGRVSS